MAATTATPSDAPAGPTGAGARDFLGARHGVASWFATRDHKRVALLYLMGTTMALAVGAVLALMMRLELTTPEVDFSVGFLAESVKADLVPQGMSLYNRLFTLHGGVMVFAFLAPLMPGVFGSFFVPLMVGARNVAFPRLNLVGFYLWLTGIVLVMAAILAGSPDTGWSLATPYSLETEAPVALAAAGYLLLGLSVLATSVTLIATVHRARTRGMTWGRLPLFVWGVYASSWTMALASPALVLAMTGLIAERLAPGTLGLFDPSQGGEPLLYRNLFWFYAHPAIYVAILPAMGLVSEVFAVHARKHIYGYRVQVGAFIALAALGLLTWGQHLAASGQAPATSAIFSVFAVLAAVPALVVVVSWVATLHDGSVGWSAPMLYALTFVTTFTLGVLSWVFLGVLSTGAHLGRSAFVMGHLHYWAVGGVVVALLAGLYHWWPKMFGRLYAEQGAKRAAGVVFVGVHLSFFPQLILGAKGMPSQWASYAPQYEGLQIVSTVGAWVLVLGLAMAFAVLLMSIRSNRPAPANPWGGVSLEWATPSPPPEENFDALPVVGCDPYEFPEIDRDRPPEKHR